MVINQYKSTLVLPSLYHHSISEVYVTNASNLLLLIQKLETISFKEQLWMIKYRFMQTHARKYQTFLQTETC